MAKLKVFRSTLGFFETVVAAPSKKAALEAWGARQDLFATGAAALETDPKAVEAALAEPGVVLRRAVGSGGAFQAQADLKSIKLPPAPKLKKGKGGKAEKAAKPRPPPDRSALTAAETALAARQARYAREREAIEARRKALDEEAAALREAFDRERSELEKARAKAAEAYRKAGG